MSVHLTSVFCECIATTHCQMRLHRYERRISGSQAINNVFTVTIKLFLMNMHRLFSSTNDAQITPISSVHCLILTTRVT